MNRILVLAGVVLAAVAALWLAGADAWLGLRESAEEGGPAAGAWRGAAPSTAPGAAAGGGGEGGAAPVLFGAPAGAPAGHGAIAGRVMDFDRGEAVAGARLLLSGPPVDGAPLSRQGASDAAGRFHFADLPAGEGYALGVQAEGRPARLLDGLFVPAGHELDLGDVWLGARGALEGRVVDAEGRGIAGASVALLPAEASVFELMSNLVDLLTTLDRESEPRARTTSGPDGAFRLTEVEPGGFTLLVRAAGFEQGQATGTMAPAGAVGGPVVVELGPREALRGIVVDEHGRGVGGARVALLPKDDVAMALHGRVFTDAGPDGRFVVPAPPAGTELILIAAAEGYATAFAQAKPTDPELRVVLDRSAELIVRLRTAQDEAPVAGALVTVMLAGAGGQNEGSLASGVTDAAGEVRLAARPGAIRMVHARHPTLGSGTYAPQLGGMLGEQDLALAGPEEFEVKPGLNVLALRLGSGTRVTGVVKDPEGRPLAGARCRGIGMLGAGAEAVSDVDGRYEFRYGGPVMMVVARLAGWVQDQDGPGGARFGEPDSLQRDAQGRIVIDVVMRRAVAVGGRVLDEAGVPLAGVTVHAAGPQAMPFPGLTGTDRTTTSAAGRYLLDGLLPGTKVTVYAEREGYVSGEVEVTAPKEGVAQAPDLTLGRGASLAVRVLGPRGTPARGAQVEVAVARSDGVRPRPDIATLMRSQGAWSRRTGGDGLARFVALPRGVATITATLAGTAGARHRLVLGVEGQPPPEEITLALRPATQIRGRVLDAEGQGVAEARVRVEPREEPAAAARGSEFWAPEEPGDAERVVPGPVPDWIPTRTAETDATGAFALEDLPEGEVTLVVTHDGYQRLKVPWRGRGDGAELRLTPRPPGDAQRVAEIDAEIQRLIQHYQSAKDEDSRAALQQQLGELYAERQKLADD